ncbi:thiol reductant ABC exporter subunit CydD [Nitratireductor kimnyeongensis]|uniref:Thiol reductant ABC exporter subunit CydD n=1 Tax=Nitratireductor kimnyeongensis TaxID=430679 RepID=A0ABW0T8T2_9HYPH|nr:thiol reductant ABC exporter subunit CydD [Nitratireductor kimnyeongensis]QZZ34075.1 thiol reductant ABC exporter subunit CydD [Nitratireductor kimnyeongensis]
MTTLDAGVRSRQSPADVRTIPMAQRAHFSKAAESLSARGTSRAAVVLQTLASLLWLPQAALLAMAVGDIAAGDGATAAWLPAIGIFLLGAMRAALDGAGGRMAFRRARRCLSALRNQAVAGLAEISPLSAARPSSGLAASTLAEQAEAIVPYVARYRPARMRAMIVPLAILACVLAFSWAAALVLLMAAPLIPVFMALVGWRAKAASEEQLAEMGSMNAFLIDRLRGMTTIRSFDAVDRTATRLRATAEDLRSRTMAVLRIAFLSSAVLELFAALGVAMVAVYVGFHLLGELNFGAWGSKLSLAEGLFILLLAPSFFEPLRELSSVWHDRASGEAALAALEKLGASGPKIVGHPDRAVREVGGVGALCVSIEGLTFRHTEEAAPVFSSFDLEVSAGERVALVAPSGAGKSTLLALIAGLVAPEVGTVRIGGQPMEGARAAELRPLIAWVGQNPHIFPGTMLSNITMGRPEVGHAAVAEVLQAVSLSRLAEMRGPAMIGESGFGLSGGEALRLALARAAATPHAGLVLADEPTAHLDRETAHEITESLLQISQGKTLIVATHDPVLAARMDRVIAVQPMARGGGRS